MIAHLVFFLYDSNVFFLKIRYNSNDSLNRKMEG